MERVNVYNGELVRKWTNFKLRKDKILRTICR